MNNVDVFVAWDDDVVSLFVWAEIVGRRVEDRQHNCRRRFDDDDDFFFLAAVDDDDDDLGGFIFAPLIFLACLL